MSRAGQLPIQLAELWTKEVKGQGHGKENEQANARMSSQRQEGAGALPQSAGRQP